MIREDDYEMNFDSASVAMSRKGATFNSNIGWLKFSTRTL